MGGIDVRKALDGKWEDGTRPKDLYARHVAPDPSRHVADIVAGLSSGNRRVQGGCAELASLLAEDRPELLYPYLASFQANLKAKEPILRWEAVCTLGNLVAVDRSGRIRENVDVLLGHLRDKSIVLQGHAVRALGKLGRAFPDLASRIVDALVAARDLFPRNRIGFVIEALPALAVDAALASRIRAFVEPFAASEVRPVATKARKALRLMGGTPPYAARLTSSGR